MPEKSNIGVQPSFLLLPFHSVQNPHHGMIPHMLGVTLLAVSSQMEPELRFPGASHPLKLTVKVKHLVTAPLHAGRGWEAFHREFWALALAGPTAKTLFLRGEVLASSCSLCEPGRGGFKLQHGLTRAWFFFSLLCFLSSPGSNLLLNLFCLSDFSH